MAGLAVGLAAAGCAHAARQTCNIITRPQTARTSAAEVKAAATAAAALEAMGLAAVAATAVVVKVEDLAAAGWAEGGCCAKETRELSRSAACAPERGSLLGGGGEGGGCGGPGGGGLGGCGGGDGGGGAGGPAMRARIVAPPPVPESVSSTTPFTTSRPEPAPEPNEVAEIAPDTLPAAAVLPATVNTLYVPL